MYKPELAHDPKSGKIGFVTLIRSYFGKDVDATQFRALTDVDRVQLGSGIAKEYGILQEDLSFELQTY